MASIDQKELAAALGDVMDVVKNAIAQAVGPLADRLSAIESRVGKSSGSFDGAKFGKEVAEAVRGHVERATAPILARLDEIETRGFRYRGVHQRAETYKRGDLVTHGGSMWAATRPVDDGAVPGEGSTNPWVLAVKRGTDGKDAR